MVGAENLRVTADERWTYPLPQSMFPRSAAQGVCTGVTGMTRTSLVDGVDEYGFSDIFGETGMVCGTK